MVSNTLTNWDLVGYHKPPNPFMTSETQFLTSHYEWECDFNDVILNDKYI